MSAKLALRSGERFAGKGSLNAASRSRPVVVLASLSGFDGSPESMQRLRLEYGAEIATAVLDFEGPCYVWSYRITTAGHTWCFREN